MPQNQPQLPPPPNQPPSYFANLLSGLQGLFGMGGQPAAAPVSAAAPQPAYQLSPEAKQMLSLLQEFPDERLQTESRHQIGLSPLGYPEVTVPWMLGSGSGMVLGATQNAPDAANRQVYDMPQAVRELLNTYYRNDPMVVYAKGPEPTTLNHERIHVGQRLSGYPNTLSQSVMEQMLTHAQQRGLVDPRITMKSPREAPAYSFQDPANYSPEDFAAYMDDVHLRAPRPWGLEASMPQAEMEKYLKTHPVPYNKAPRIKMKEVKK